MAGNIIPSRARLVPNVIQPQIMKNHQAPVVILQLSVDVTGNIVVDLGEILPRGKQRHGPCDSGDTNRDKEARCAIFTIECIGKKLEPSVVAEHEKLSGVFGLELGQPGVLSRKA